MNRRSHLPWCALLALGILGVTVQAEPDPALQKAVNKLVADVAAGKKISANEAKAFAKKWDELEEVMKAAYHPEKKAPTLEAVLIKLSEKATFKAADKATLTKIANLSRAMAVVTPHYPNPGGAAKKRAWDGFSADMNAGAMDLLAAIKMGNNAAIKGAATRLGEVAPIATDDDVLFQIAAVHQVGSCTPVAAR